MLFLGKFQINIYKNTSVAITFVFMICFKCSNKFIFFK